MIGQRPEQAGTAATDRARTRAAWSSRKAASCYDSDYYGDELPFWVNVDGKGQLVVPYSLTNNDGKYMIGIGNADQWFTLVKDSFDMLYREGATQPRMMSVGMHMRVIGHPGRAVGLERLLDYMQKHKGVWITKRVEIAQALAPRRTRIRARG